MACFLQGCSGFSLRNGNWVGRLGAKQLQVRRSLGLAAPWWTSLYTGVCAFRSPKFGEAAAEIVGYTRIP